MQQWIRGRHVDCELSEGGLMRIWSVAVLIGIIVLSTIPAMAFYPSGTLDQNLSYDSVEITDSFCVSGKINNRTSKPIKVDGAVIFATIHKQVINYARINLTVPPKGSARFRSPLAKRDHKQTRNAYELRWYIRDYSTTTKRHKPHQNVPEYKSNNRSSGYANTRTSGAFIKAFGTGSHNSDPFELKYGLYTVKVSHVGKSTCRINLVHQNGGLASNITNGSGCILESKTVRIEWGGFYYLDVFADGDWTVSMEYQAPEGAQDSELSDRNMPDSSGASNPVMIVLKNGRTMHADYYWEAGDKLKVSIYGAIMTIDKKDVKEITAPTP
jgi:hypothetical protein